MTKLLALRTHRLTLLPITAAIAEAALHDRPALSDLIDASVSSDWPADLRPLFPMYADSAFAACGEAGWGPWVVVDPSLRELVGDAGFKGTPSETGEVELGYSTVARYRGCGYATEAASRIVEWAFAQPGVTAVVAECEQNNLASARVLSKVGMTETGRRDTLSFWRIE